MFYISDATFHQGCHQQFLQFLVVLRQDLIVKPLCTIIVNRRQHLLVKVVFELWILPYVPTVFVTVARKCFVLRSSLQ